MIQGQKKRHASTRQQSSPARPRASGRAESRCTHNRQHDTSRYNTEHHKAHITKICHKTRQHVSAAHSRSYATPLHTPTDSQPSTGCSGMNTNPQNDPQIHVLVITEPKQVYECLPQQTHVHAPCTQCLHGPTVGTRPSSECTCLGMQSQQNAYMHSSRNMYGQWGKTMKPHAPPGTPRCTLMSAVCERLA